LDGPDGLDAAIVLERPPGADPADGPAASASASPFQFPAPRRTPPELTPAEAVALRDAVRAYTPELAARNAVLPPAEAFPPPAGFADAVARVSAADRLAA